MSHRKNVEKNENIDEQKKQKQESLKKLQNRRKELAQERSGHPTCRITQNPFNKNRKVKNPMPQVQNQLLTYSLLFAPPSNSIQDQLLEALQKNTTNS